MRLLFFIIIYLITQTSFSQEFIQLLGLESDDSEFSKGSYAIMYDSAYKKRENKKYVPLQTIGIYRNNDIIKIMALDYLLIPTQKGFIYGTLNVEEIKYDSKNNEFDLPDDTYELSSSTTKPIFFTNKKSITYFTEQQKPTFKDAIQIDFEKISFINSKFYLTKGFNSMVHGGASWFNAVEKTNIYPLDSKQNLSNKVTDYIDNTTKNKIIINTINNMEGYGFEDHFTPDSELPWAGTIDSHKKVFFDINFKQYGVQITPLTLLQGNSSRSFLAEGTSINSQEIYDKLQLKKAMKNATSNNVIKFLSPDSSTVIEINNKVLIITDYKTGTILKKVQLNYNKIIMSEFALDNYAKKWKSEFE